MECDGRSNNCRAARALVVTFEGSLTNVSMVDLGGVLAKEAI